jgi:hypothetical protein
VDAGTQSFDFTEMQIQHASLPPKRAPLLLSQLDSDAVVAVPPQQNRELRILADW